MCMLCEPYDPRTDPHAEEYDPTIDHTTGGDEVVYADENAEEWT